MPVSTVYDGFATIRRPRVGPPRNPPRPPSLASVPEDSTGIGNSFYNGNGINGFYNGSNGNCGCASPVGNPSVPWWDLATRKSRYRSCPSLELNVSIIFIY